MKASVYGREERRAPHELVDEDIDLSIDFFNTLGPSLDASFIRVFCKTVYPGVSRLEETARVLMLGATALVIMIVVIQAECHITFLREVRADSDAVTKYPGAG
ncbi:hypothetical protein ARMSODRAFT_979303 [Armillaria solidipes]|uniref:Uncharacterized protein n=1 Tax=Armillaria solidipes TaxID=1076256 RepID=A0A2H3B3B4_9AGAR|nr:hypothetical protein ARMSODRAFT_979303 [Armillaria solidipes]